MDHMSIAVKKGEAPKPFPKPRSTALLSILQKLKEQDLSMEEAEEKAGVEKGVILKALETNDMLAPMDGYHLNNALCEK